MLKLALSEYRNNGVKVGFIPRNDIMSQCLNRIMDMPKTVQEILYECPKPGFFMDVTVTVYDLLSVPRNKTIVVPMPDKNYGSRENGTWTGLIGNISRSEIDSSLAGISQSTKRMEATDFSQTFLSVTLGFLTR